MSQGPWGYMGRSMRSLSPYIKQFVCITDYVKSLVESYGVPEEKVSRIYNGTNTDVEKEFPSSLRQELQVDLDTFVIGTTGIWRPNKGFPYFIAAGEILNRWHPTVKFFLGGRAYGPDAAYATTLWMRGSMLRASRSLEYTGFVRDIGQFMSALDLFVLPSDCEPFGLVLIEAMARGIPVIATAAGGVPEIVKNNETGLLVPPRNPEAMAEAMNYMLCHPEQRVLMGQAGRAHVQNNFNQLKMIREYETLYLELARRHL